MQGSLSHLQMAAPIINYVTPSEFDPVGIERTMNLKLKPIVNFLKEGA